jgi:hypothetical protein
MMRGTDGTSGSLFSYVDLEARIPARHPLHKLRQVVNEALASFDAEFEVLYTDFGRPSIAPERLIRASLIQILFSVRSGRQLMEQMQYNLLFRWFVGLGIGDPVRMPTVFTKSRARLLPTDMSRGNRDIQRSAVAPPGTRAMPCPRSTASALRRLSAGPRPSAAWPRPSIAASNACDPASS